jgi:hypothetical protein
MKNYIKVGYEVIDGRMYLDLSTNKETIEYTETLSVISGALSMVIRIAAENGHETEGEVMRSVVNYLESEFINPDSFSDIDVKRPNDGENSK